MPIQNGKYVAPTWQNNNPPGIDQNELQAISDTIEGMTPGGGGGERYATIVVGTSTNGWNQSDCDYLCDGVDDQVEINQAIAALPTDGGEVLLLDGTYYLSVNISRLVSSTLRGTNRDSVTLKRMTTNGYGGTGSALIVGSNNGIISDLSYDGNKAIFQSSTSGVYDFLIGGGAKMKNISIFSCADIAVYAEPITSYATDIDGCWFNNINGPCVYADYGGYLSFHDCCSNGLNPLLEAVGQEHDGTPIQEPLTIHMSNVISTTKQGGISINGGGFCAITNCVCDSIQFTNTVPTGPIAVERGRHILIGNQFNPAYSSSGVVISFGAGVNNCLAIGNMLDFAQISGTIQDNGQNNIVYNGASSGQVTLSGSGWSGSTQTVSAPGVTLSSVVTTSPIPTNMSTAMSAGVYCSGQGNGTLTFTCASTPSSSITYTYTTQGVF